MNSQTVWRVRLTAALEANEHLPQSRYVQLATVRADGRPANRTLVFRGFQDPGDHLLFATDRRSEKIVHLKANPWVEVCWYLSASREQFRVLGRIELIGAAADQIRTRIWNGLSEPSRQSFTWPKPSSPRAGREEFTRPVPTMPPPSFALLVVHPEEIDHVDLRPDPQTRTIFRRVDETWIHEVVNP